MEIWSLLFFSFFFSICLALCFLADKPKTQKLPPGPPAVPLLGSLLWLSKPLSDIESTLWQLRTQYGPILTLRIGSQTNIFISDHSIAHQALITRGADFAHRPPTTAIGRILSANQHNITSSGYGPLLRLLRRNLTSEILHPSRVKSFSRGKAWVLEVLVQKLKSESESGKTVPVMETFQYAMFCLLLFMCFGQRLEEKVVREVEVAHKRMLVNLTRVNVFAFFPIVAKLVFRKLWNETMETKQRQREVLLPLIRARKESQMKGEQEDEKSFLFAYVDTLFELELPDEGGRKLTEEEIVVLCSEFLNTRTDTTSTALQWVMANLVKHSKIQEKLAQEIERVAREREGGDGKHPNLVLEEDLQKMKYLKAVVMETLRRHPPGHLALPHGVKEEKEINGYVIPKDASVIFTVAEMGVDEEVWEDAKEFKPERFIEEEVDMTGSREIKMMPFGAGRRICPAMSLAMLHLEWFVANLVREFEWKVGDGEEGVDLSEKTEFTTVMKNPLKALLIPRRKISAFGNHCM